MSSDISNFDSPLTPLTQISEGQSATDHRKNNNPQGGKQQADTPKDKHDLHPLEKEDETTLSVDAFLSTIRDDTAQLLNYYDSYNEAIPDTHDEPVNPALATYQKRASLSYEKQHPRKDPFPFIAPDGLSDEDEERFTAFKNYWDNLETLRFNGITHIPYSEKKSLYEALDIYFEKYQQLLSL